MEICDEIDRATRENERNENKAMRSDCWQTVWK